MDDSKLQTDIEEARAIARRERTKPVIAPEGTAKIWKTKTDDQYRVSIPRKIGRALKDEFDKGAYIHFKIDYVGSTIPRPILQVTYTTKPKRIEKGK